LIQVIKIINQKRRILLKSQQLMLQLIFPLWN